MAEIVDDDRQEFWEWAFEQSGTNPLSWQHSARDLLEAADVVKARVQNLGVGLMHSLAAASNSCGRTSVSR